MSRTFGYRELLTKEVVEAWRTYRLAALCGLFIVIGIAVPLIVRFLPSLLRMFGASGDLGLGELGVAEVVDMLVRNVTQVGGIAAIVLTMGAIAGERRRGTLDLVLSRPVSRAAVIWAKFVALGMAFGLAIGLAVAGAWLYSALFFSPQAALPWGQLGAVLWLLVMCHVAVTLLASAVAATPLGAAIVGLGFVAAMTLASSVASLARFLPIGLAEVARAVALEEPRPDLAPAVTIAVSVVLIGVALVAAWWRLRRMDV